MLGSSLGRSLGLTFGSYLGRQIALGACRDDGDDDFPRKPFTSRVPLPNLPRAVDLRPWMPVVEDQGALGSCCANALVGALEYLTVRERGERTDLSRIFVYYNQRLWDGGVREDVGATVVDGVRVLSRVGVPTEKSWPYLRGLFAVQPPEPVYAEAARHKVTDWWSIDIDVDAMRACLAAGFPVVFGTRVTESFMKPPPSGMIAIPSASDRDDAKHGRHALLLVGYDDARRTFVVRNSWGDDWGDRGYCYMPYAYLGNRSWTRNAWALRLASGAHDPKAPPPVDLRTVPAAEPARGGAPGGGAGVAGQVAGVGAELAVGMLTGSGLLAGLAGGLLSGVTPGVMQGLRGRDVGVTVGADRSKAVLALMRAGGAAPAHQLLPWDDGLDERAAVARLSRTAEVRPGEREHGPEREDAAPASAIVDAGAAVVTAGALITGAAKAPIAPAPEPSKADPSDLAAVIERAHTEAGGARGPLGAAMPPPVSMDEGGYHGLAMRFSAGGIFVWVGQGGAPLPALVFRDTDPLYKHWLALGAARSPLAWPSDPIQTAPDGATRMLPCTRGVILAHPRLGARAISGVLYGAWQSRGGLSSDLGFPTEDQRVVGEGFAQRFERGELTWSPEAGAR